MIKHKVFIVGFIICLCMSISSAIYLRSNKTFEELSLYTSAICKNDLHAFKSATCEECGSDITETGIFFNRELKEDTVIETESDTKKFSDYFESYEDYKKSSNSVSVASIIFLIGILVLPISIITDLKYVSKEVK
jgi:hypothetical protein